MNGQGQPSAVVPGDLRHLLRKMSPERRALVAKLLAESGGPAPLASPVPVRAPGENCPLSYAEQRLWFLDRLEPDSPWYNVHRAVTVRHPVRPDLLRRVYEQVVEHHEILRTTYPARDGRPRRRIAPSQSIDFEVVDLRELPEPEREFEAHRRLREDARRPFDLENGPLVRVRLLVLGEEWNIILAAFHHIVSDGRSVHNWLGQTYDLYAALRDGEPSPLPPLPIQYADYALWQRSEDQARLLEPQLDYWKQRLAGAPPFLALPADRPRPRSQSYQGDQLPLRLPADLGQQLRALGRGENATLYMMLLAAWTVLLARYSGQTDVLVGSPVANRDRPEFEHLIGCFINTVVLRVDLSGDPTFRELLHRVREAVLEALANKDLPFEKLVDELRPERVLSHQPIFQVMLNLQEYRSGELQSGDDYSSIDLHNGTSVFDLMLSLTETGAGLEGFLEYNTDLFDEATIVRHWDHLSVLLDAIIADPDQPISRLPLLRAAERTAILQGWNQTGKDYPATTIHALVEEQAARTPGAVAIVHQGRAWSYAELNRRANRIAHSLRQRGVERESLAGISMNRGPEMVAAILGILKAGAAYVPLDPRYPPARLATMIADSRMQVLLGAPDLEAGLAEYAGDVTFLDVTLLDREGASDENPAEAAAPGSLAYVIYTSGSTGRPKGVAIEHRSVVNLVCWARETFPAELWRGVLAGTSISFDISVFEFFAPLVAGGAIVLAEDVREIPEASGGVEITLVSTVPSAMAALVDGRRIPASARAVVLAGEKLSTPLVDRIYNETSIREVYDLYGSTETTVHSTLTLRERAAPANVGRPLANTRIYVLDEHGQPVPPGVRGEAWIGGAGVARGYLHQPGLTAERFLSDPFAARAGARMYRTGDVARHRADGTLEILGRRDNQVKVRGFRIEIEEVEAAIREHPGVRECGVIVSEPIEGDRRLAGFFETNGAAVATSEEVRRFLSARLPDYMVPATLIALDELPRTASGKIDRNALEPPLTPPRADHGGPVAPRDALEAQFVRMWERVLNVHPVGITDNFFDLGGHSLLAVALFAELEKVMGRRLPLATLFEAPTPAELARVVRTEGWSPPWKSLVAIHPGGSRPPLYCIHADGGEVLFYQDLAHHLGPDQPVFGLQSPGLDGETEPLDSVEEIAAHYLSVIRTLEPKGPYHLAGFCLGAYIAHEMARQLQEQGEEVPVLGVFNTDGGWKTVDSWFDGLAMHRRYLRKTSLREKAAYVAFRLRYRLGRATILGGHGFSALLRRFGRTPSLSLRQLHLRRANLRAVDRFSPGVYRGRLIYFQGKAEPNRTPEQFWEPLVTGGIETHVVEGKGIDVLLEPGVRQVAERLGKLLGQPR